MRLYLYIVLVLSSVAAVTGVTVACCDLANLKGNLTSANTVIALAAGTFTGNCGVLALATPSVPITLVGVATAATVIDCQGTGRHLHVLPLVGSTPTVIANMTFINGYSGTLRGGSLFIEDAPAVLSGLSFVNNSNLNWGGAVSQSMASTAGCTLVVDSCSFTGNRVNQSATTVGGAVQTEACAVSLSNSVFAGNTGNYGIVDFGSTHGDSYNVTKCLFVNNNILSKGAFFASMVPAARYVSVVGSNFTGNTGPDAAAVSIDAVNVVVIRDTVFNGNLGTTHVVLLANLVAATVENVVLSSNSAGLGNNLGIHGVPTVTLTNVTMRQATGQVPLEISGSTLVSTRVAITGLSMSNVVAGCEAFLLDNYGSMTLANSSFSQISGFTALNILSGGSLSLQDISITSSTGAGGGVDKGCALQMENIVNVTANGLTITQSTAIKTFYMLNVTSTSIRRLVYTDNSGSTYGIYFVPFPSSVASIVITTATFLRNTAPTVLQVTAAGAAYTAGTFTVQNATFSGNTATLLYANVLHVDKFYGAARLIGVAFTNNSIVADAIVAVSNFGSLIVQGCLFQGSNVTFNSQGSIHVASGSSVAVADTLFVNNTFAGFNNAQNVPPFPASISAGIYAEFISSLVITNSLFDKNTVSLNAPALYATNVITLNVTGSNFTRNTGLYQNTLGSAGAVIVYHTRQLVFTNCAFTSNRIVNSGYGGAVYIYDANTTFTGCTFTRNTADYGGAVVFVFDSSPMTTVTFMQCTASFNNATSSGGVIYTQSSAGCASQMNIVESTFQNNTAHVASCIWHQLPVNASNIFVINRSTFSMNGIPALCTVSVQFDGAYAIVSVVGSKFDTNFIGIGNALIQAQPTLSGGIFPVTLINSTFTNNHGPIVAIFVTAGISPFSASGCTFIGNTDGGLNMFGLTFQPPPSQQMNLTNCLFKNNRYIGIFFQRGGVIRIDGSTFIGNQNTALAGAVVNGDAVQVTVTASTFNSNSAVGIGGAIYLTSSSNLTIAGGSSFVHNINGAIYMNSGTASVAQDTYFAWNNQSVNLVPRFDGDFTRIGACTTFDSNITLPAAGECPGVRGYACPVLCKGNEVSSSLIQGVMCSMIPKYDISPCTPATAVRATWIAGNSTMTTVRYGTQGVWSTSNVAPFRAGATLLESRDLPGFVLIFGGSGYAESPANVGQDPNNVMTGYILGDTWLVNTTLDVPTLTWILGPKSTTSPTLPVYSSTSGTPGARLGAASWTIGTIAYMHGGFGAASGTNQHNHLSCLWSLDLATRTTWKYVSGGQSGDENPVYGTLHTFGPTVLPGARYGHAAFTLDSLPNAGVVYGGNGFSNDGFTQFGYLSDVWVYNVTLSQWAWFGGDVTVNNQPAYGTQNVSSVSNSPGGRAWVASYSSGAAVFLYGGTGWSTTPEYYCIARTYSDLWKGVFDTSFRTFSWAFISGGTGFGSVGIAPNLQCLGCYPYARSGASMLLLNDFSAATGFDNDILLANGFLDGTYQSDLWEMDQRGSPGQVLSGSRHVDNVVNFTTFGVPSAYTTGPRAYGMMWPDRLRKDSFYIMGGSLNSINEGVRSANDMWRISLGAFSLVIPSARIDVEAGTTFNLAGIVTKYNKAQVNPTSGLNEPAVLVSAYSALTTSPGLTVVSNGFVNGNLSLQIAGPISGTSSWFMVSITVYGVTSSINVTMHCNAACDNCTAAGVTASACVCAAGYARSLVTGDCVATCDPGYWKDTPSRVCVRCHVGCTTCTDASLQCLCNTTALYGRNASAPYICRQCNVFSGEYLDGLNCSTCAPVSNCLGGGANVTCSSALNSQCPRCVSGYWRTHGTSDSCSLCTVCAGAPVAWQVSACAASADTVCQSCTPSCATSQYIATPCTNSSNTVCAACDTVPHCDVSTPQACVAPGDSRCILCAVGYYRTPRVGANDICTPCDSCLPGTFQALPCSLAANVSCEACCRGCAACTRFGLTTHYCQACDNNVGFLLSGDGSTCTDTCLSGQFPNFALVTAPAQCTNCTTGCALCNGPGLVLGATGCRTCDQARGFLLSRDGTTCVSGCPPGEFQNTTDSVHGCAGCTAGICETGKYVSCTSSVDVECPACTVGCATCTGPGLNVSEFCTSCAAGYAPDESGLCVPCAVNCTLCSDSPTTCTVCAPNYNVTPGCAPVCSSPGCLDCLSPDACGLCMGTYQGLDCKSCSPLAAQGTAYPNCDPARVTDVAAVGGAMGLLLLIVIVVTVFVLRSPLPVFYHGSQRVQTPSAVIPMAFDFILSTRTLTVSIDPPVTILEAFLEGPGLLPKAVVLVPSATNKGRLEVSLKMTRKQMTFFTSGQIRVEVIADAGLGPVTTAHFIHIPLRRTVPNALALLTILIDFVQMSSFAFGKSVTWWSKDPIPTTLHYSLLILPPALDLWYYSFWILMGLALVWVILVIVIKTGLDQKLSRCPGSRAFLTPIYSTFMPFVGQTLYMPIISVMLSVVACSKEITNLAAPFTANFDGHVKCWEGDHWLYVALAVFTILIYYPLAVYTQPLWQTTAKELDVRYFPVYLGLTSQMKFLLAVTNQMFNTVVLVEPLLLIVLSVPVVVFILRQPPTIIHTLRGILLASYLSVGWVGIASMVAIFYPDQWISAVVLYGGWVLMVGASIMLTVRKPHKTATDPDDDDAVDAVRRVLNANPGAKSSVYEASASPADADAPESVELLPQAPPGTVSDVTTPPPLASSIRGDQMSADNAHDGSSTGDSAVVS